MPEPLWDLATVAGYLVKSTKTLRNWMQQTPPYGPPVYVVGGEYRYDPSEVREWVREQSVSLTGERVARALASRGEAAA